MTPCWLLVLLCSPLWHSEGVEGWGGLSTVPSESECRPYIEKALKELTPEDPLEAVDATGSENETPPSQSADQEGSIEETEEATTKESIETFGEGQLKSEEESSETGETTDTESTEENPNKEAKPDEEVTQADEPSEGLESTETQESTLQEIENETNDEESTETDEEKVNVTADKPSSEDGSESTETEDKAEATSTEGTDDASAIERSDETPDDATTEEKSNEDNTLSGEENVLETTESTEQEAEDVIQPEESEEKGDTAEQSSSEEKPEEAKEATSEESTERVDKSEETAERVDKSEEAQSTEEVGDRSAEVQGGEETDSAETNESLETKSLESTEPQESIETKSDEEPKDIKEDTTETETSTEDSAQITKESEEEAAEGKSESASEESSSETTATSTTEEMLESSTEAIPEPTEEPSATPKDDVVPDTIQATPTIEKDKENEAEVVEPTEQEPATEEEPVKEAEPTTTAEDQLTLMFEVPKVRRPRDHIAEILNLTPESAETELLLAKTIDSTLRDLKKLYDSAIQPLEILYKYRDLSNRHFGDPEIFSKPLILFMGPWSGGKSTILNYLMDNEFKSSSLRTGAEPSPAYFNILMWGEREEVLDGTQLAADWTFSGLQKFGQGLLDRLRGLRLKSPLLEKVNIVEIPGILEIRKQVERLFPFNDACQWFIDRADIIFLVYDPSKLDVGPETEAILDQLKGREYQTRIILNKADQVKPEELMRVQGTLIWNISPLMSSQEPPVMYSTSLWSIPYEQGAPSRLLHAQERAFLRDLRTAIDKRVENKIASARRFAVRVRNHAKMVDCYLTTYYNHKTFFGNRKKVADDIIETPQKYHIYEGLSTLTNISRYDLPDPEVYRDFFQLNPVYDFQRLSDTCTYFRGCPINRLDVAIAYDLPELVGKYKKQAERVLEAAEKQAAKS